MVLCLRFCSLSRLDNETCRIAIISCCDKRLYHGWWTVGVPRPNHLRAEVWLSWNNQTTTFTFVQIPRLGCTKWSNMIPRLGCTKCILCLDASDAHACGNALSSFYHMLTIFWLHRKDKISGRRILSIAHWFLILATVVRLSKTWIVLFASWVIPQSLHETLNVVWILNGWLNNSLV